MSEQTFEARVEALRTLLSTGAEAFIRKPDAIAIAREADETVARLERDIEARSLTALETIAKAATPGPYQWDKRELCVYAPDGRIMFDRSVDCDDTDEADAQFIAAFNPTVALRLLTELREARQTIAGRQWQPIATAPKDGSRVIIGWPSGYVTAGYLAPVRGTWVTVNGEYTKTLWPTHWMPLPAPPKAGE